MKHTPNKKQKDSFEALKKAFDRCKKEGLVIYAKCGDIVAYTRQANDYVENEHGFEVCISSYNSCIPYLSANVLADSGADDYPGYVSEEDRLKFNP